MWSLLLVCTCLASATARTTQILPKPLEGFSSKLAVDAQGTVTKNNIEDITGSVVVEQNPFLVGVSRATDDTVSAILGFADNVAINQASGSPIVANVEAVSQFSTKSVQGQLTVGTSSFVGNPSASVGATITKDGLTNYGLGLEASSKDGKIQANAQLTGVPKDGVTLQATTQIGPVAGIVTRNTAGLWDEKVGTELVIFENPKITLLGGLHRNTANAIEYVLGISSPVAWGDIRIDTNNAISYNLGGSGSGVQDNIPYTLTGDFAYLAPTKALQYNMSATVGPVTGGIAGQLYNYHDLYVQLNLDMFVLSLTVGAQGNPSYSFGIFMKNANANLLLDENFKPYNLSGMFWGSLMSVAANTDFNGDYNFSVKTQDQVVTFTL